jgi:hypothetical protein
MKAEIGFARDDNWQPTDRLQLILTPETATEATTVMVFANRVGLRYDEVAGNLVISETALLIVKPLAEVDHPTAAEIDALASKK